MTGYTVKGVHFDVDHPLSKEEKEALSQYADWLNAQAEKNKQAIPARPEEP